MYRTVQCKNGKFAVWSTISDGVCAYDMTEQELIEFFKEIAIENSIDSTKRFLERHKEGHRPYYYDVTLKATEKTIKKYENKCKEVKDKKSNYEEDRSLEAWGRVIKMNSMIKRSK